MRRARRHTEAALAQPEVRAPWQGQKPPSCPTRSVPRPEDPAPQHPGSAWHSAQGSGSHSPWQPAPLPAARRSFQKSYLSACQEGRLSARWCHPWPAPHSASQVGLPATCALESSGRDGAHTGIPCRCIAPALRHCCIAVRGAKDQTLRRRSRTEFVSRRSRLLIRESRPVIA